MIRTERQFGEFKRQFTIPADVEADKITAKFADGVLELNVPLPKKSQKPAGSSVKIE